MGHLYAYFIGGPWDLTKQVINHILPEIRVARPETLTGISPLSTEEDPMEPVKLRESIYRPRTEGPRSGPYRTIIYHYEGEIR